MLRRTALVLAAELVLADLSSAGTRPARGGGELSDSSDEYGRLVALLRHARTEDDIRLALAAYFEDGSRFGNMHLLSRLSEDGLVTNRMGMLKLILQARRIDQWLLQERQHAELPTAATRNLPIVADRAIPVPTKSVATESVATKSVPTESLRKRRIAMVVTGQLGRLELPSKFKLFIAPNVALGHTVDAFLSLTGHADNVLYGFDFLKRTHSCSSNVTLVSDEQHIRRLFLLHAPSSFVNVSFFYDPLLPRLPLSVQQMITSHRSRFHVWQQFNASVQTELDKRSRLIDHFYRWTRAADMIVHKETQSKVVYDYILVLRDDLVVYRKFEMTSRFQTALFPRGVSDCVVKSCCSFGGINDKMMLCAGTRAKSYLSLPLDHLRRTQVYPAYLSSRSFEELLLNMYRLFKMPIRRVEPRALPFTTAYTPCNCQPEAQLKFDSSWCMRPMNQDCYYINRSNPDDYWYSTTTRPPPKAHKCYK